jgi:tetratricopeptide (TPR) repeat protein
MKKTTSLILMMLIMFAGAVLAQNPQTEELTKLYTAGEFEQTIEKGREFLKDDPQNIDYNAVLGRALVDNGQYAEAIPFLKFVAENDNTWQKAWSVGYLGSAYFMLADYENSKAALQTATQLNITANATKYASRNWLLFGFQSFFDNWKTSETKHIRFHFQNMSDTEMESFMQSREKAFETVQQFFRECIAQKNRLFCLAVKR